MVFDCYGLGTTSAVWQTIMPKQKINANNNRMNAVAFA